jgi:outer membrane murein-binding lipoprotein Lpp
MTIRTIKKVAAFACVVAAAGLAGCASVPKPGKVASETPPRLVAKADQTLAWDNPSAFGPVPAAEAARGASVCGSLDNDKTKFKATGYHAGALDAYGNPFPGGGFYCVAK